MSRHRHVSNSRGISEEAPGQPKPCQDPRNPPTSLAFQRQVPPDAIPDAFQRRPCWSLPLYAPEDPERSQEACLSPVRGCQPSRENGGREI